MVIFGTPHINDQGSDAEDWSLTSFADRLRTLIGPRGKASFAAAAGVTPQTISKYLKGAEPGRDKLLAIADAAGVSVQWLASGRGQMRVSRGDEIEAKMIAGLPLTDEERQELAEISRNLTLPHRERNQADRMLEYLGDPDAGHRSADRSQAFTAGQRFERETAAVALDIEFHARVVDGIDRIYKDLKIALPAIELGRLSGEMYQELVNALPPEDRSGGLRLRLHQLREGLLKAPPGETKQLA